MPCLKLHSRKLAVHVWLCTCLSLSMWCNAEVGNIINHNQALEKLLCVWDLHYMAEPHMSGPLASMKSHVERLISAVLGNMLCRFCLPETALLICGSGAAHEMSTCV